MVGGMSLSARLLGAAAAPPPGASELSSAAMVRAARRGRARMVQPTPPAVLASALTLTHPLLGAGVGRGATAGWCDGRAAASLFPG